MCAVADVDLIIVGSGSGNSILTPDLDDWTVVIAERGTFGGTCLNAGCIPSKMLVLPADRVVEAAESARLGVTFDAPTVDWPAIRDRLFARIDPISAGGLEYRKGLDRVRVIEGEARFVGERRLRIGDDEVSAEQVVIAAGARPYVPPVPGLADVPFHTSDTIMRIDTLPEHLVILGGGYIAAELGHVVAALGSRVSIVHRGDRLLRHEDDDVSARFTEAFGRHAFLHLNADPERIAYSGGEFTVTLDDHELQADALLVATGRIPNGDQLDVELAGVALSPAGYVLTDDELRTSAPGVWAIGDVRNPLQLKHLANHEAEVVAHNLVHPESLRSIDERVVPHAVFSHPQVGSVGRREVELRAAGLPYRVGRRDYGGVAYGWALEDDVGFAKVLVDPGTRQILGGHVIGAQAATLVQQLVQAMQFEIPADRLAREQIWCHPALSEVVENALLDALD